MPRAVLPQVLAGLLVAQAAAAADLILRNGNIVTLDPIKPRVEAVAIAEGLVVATGSTGEVMKRKTSGTRVIDLGGRTVIPGLNDSHAHVVRGGRFYNLELRWDGVRSLERALAMVAEQARLTPDGQWVRVGDGGTVNPYWSVYGGKHPLTEPWNPP